MEGGTYGGNPCEELSQFFKFYCVLCNYACVFGLLGKEVL